MYLTFDRISGRNRAVKEVMFSSNGQMHERARREAELVWQLKYPYFPEIYEVLETGEADYLVMEYLEGETLGERLRRLGPLPWQEVQRWGKDLCLMLGYLHSSTPPVIYQDMKPDNIMVQPRGNLRLIDFGAVMKGQERTQLRFGTRGYAAPEQFDSESMIAARTDIYALGQTMYQLITGMNPGKTNGVSKGFPRKKFPRKLRKIIKKCVSENPAGRYQDCQKLRDALCRI